MFRNKMLIVVITLFLFAMISGGCGIQKNSTEKIRDLDFTVLEEMDVPEKLMEKIEERKADDFKMTYREGDSLYIARGFGMQETGGYSIQVKEFYLTDNAVYFEADLLGPQSRQDAGKAASYPYIVIKTERLEENVVFE